MTEEPHPYPDEWAADVVLSDGSTAHVRPIRATDGEAIADLHSRLSPETIYLRFFSPLPRLSPRQIERFTHVDYHDRFALVALIDDRIVAVARYDQQGTPGEAEVAFVVDDAYQGRGLGTLLLEHLAAVARTQGVGRLVADVLPENQRMLGVFREAGFTRETAFADGITRVRMLIEPTAASEQAMAEREARADRRSIERILRPSSVAVVGASTEPGSIGHELFRNLLRGGFEGPVYPVHPTADHVASVRAYATIGEIPDEVDLAVIVVPPAAMEDVIDQCGAKGVRGLVIVTAGYAETGPAGAAAERELVRRAHGRGMRVIGPNCMGVINAAPDVRLNATFAPVDPRPGNVGFLSQSGALGIAILGEAERLGIGLSTFVSVGNKADVSGNDLIQYWAGDPTTQVILLYLESFGNPRKFSRIARRVSRTKPIVAVKSARTRAGMRATSTPAGDEPTAERTVEALFRHAGVIRVDTLQQLFDVAKVLASQPLPAGGRVGIVSNAGGPGILAADTCEALGLEVPDVAAATRERLVADPHIMTTHNPVHLAPTAGPASYEHALRCVADDPNVDSVLAVFVPPLAAEVDAVAAAICRGAEHTTKPLLANVLAHGATPDPLQAGGVPTFDYPESAVHALAKVHEYATWRAEPVGQAPQLSPPVDVDAARAVVAAVLVATPEGRTLAPDEAEALVVAAGLRDAADRVDRTELPCRVFAVDDTLFGPTITFSAGGEVADAVGDQAARLVPLTDADAARLVRAPRGSAMLEALGGAALEVAAEVVARVSVLVDELPELSKIDLRIATSAGGARVVDALIDVTPGLTRPEHLVRRLR